MLCNVFGPKSDCLCNCTCNSYTMCVRDLTDIYTQSPRAAGPRAEGVYISQITSTHGITNMCHLFVHVCACAIYVHNYVARHNDKSV